MEAKDFKLGGFYVVSNLSGDKWIEVVIQSSCNMENVITETLFDEEAQEGSKQGICEKFTYRQLTEKALLLAATIGEKEA